MSNRRFAMEYIELSLHASQVSVVWSIACLILSGCTSEKQAWENAQQTDTANSYRQFLTEFPSSEFAVEAEAMSREFSVTIFGTAEIDTLIGPVIEAVPQWDILIAILDHESSYAINQQGERVPMRYFIPVNLNNNDVKIRVKQSQSGETTVSRETRIPKVNTFNRRYNAIGTSDKRLYFELDFTETAQPIRFGIVYDDQYSNLQTIHVLGTTFQVNTD